MVWMKTETPSQYSGCVTGGLMTARGAQRERVGRTASKRKSPKGKGKAQQPPVAIRNFTQPSRGRSYGLGERNPDTLPDGSNSTESLFENERRTKVWRGILAWAKSNRGAKYVG